MQQSESQIVSDEATSYIEKSSESSYYDPKNTGSKFQNYKENNFQKKINQVQRDEQHNGISRGTVPKAENSKNRDSLTN